MIFEKPPAYPKICNICGGDVQKVNNRIVYGQTYGNGIMYLCTKCRARVGAHKSGEALGILADESLRTKKKEAHNLFDPIWREGETSRSSAYEWLSEQLGIPKELTHFGYFDHKLLNKSIAILKEARGIK